MSNEAELVRGVRLARVVEAHDGGGTVVLRDGGPVAARWSEPIRQRGIGIRPGNLVLVAPEGEALGDAGALEVIWRGPTVVRVASVEGERVTYRYEGDAGPGRGATKTVRDARPLDERRPIGAGHDIVVSFTPGEADEAVLVDVAVDG